MGALTVLQLTSKYGSIESKVPAIWKSYHEAASSLEKDLEDVWDIQNGELIRVIFFLEKNTKVQLNHHIDHSSHDDIYGTFTEPFKFI